MKHRSGHITSDKFGGFTVSYTTIKGNRVYTKFFNTRIEAVAFLHDEPKPNTHDIIKYHMREREKEVLRHVRALNRRGEGYRPEMPGMSWWNAIDRLKEKGKIRYRRSSMIHTYGRSGYWIRKGR